jgi:myo-inositol-1-phosphate synthase
MLGARAPRVQEDLQDQRGHQHHSLLAAEEDIHVGPSDYVPWLKDRKWCHIRMEGTTFGDVPLNLELKLEVWDSPNSAGVVIDAVRCASSVSITG